MKDNFNHKPQIALHFEFSAFCLFALGANTGPCSGLPHGSNLKITPGGAQEAIWGASI